jgi:hypothetical protein
MIEPELAKSLQEINNNLIEIKKRSKPGIWRSFFSGIFSALGYIAGLTIVIVILGWFLNKVGLLSAFKQQLADFSSLINEAKNIIAPDKQGSGATVVLPNGQEVKIK